MIQKGVRTRFDVEVLKQLLKLLPETHEVSVANTSASLQGAIEDGIACLNQFLVSAFRLKT